MSPCAKWTNHGQSAGLAWTLVTAFSIGVAGCSDPVERPDTRRQLLTDVTDVVYLPTLRAFAGEAPRLVTAVDELCAAPDADRLAAAQTVWRDIRRPWKRAEAFAFGPVEDLRIDSAIDFWPIRVTDIEEEMADDTPVSAEYIAGLGASRKGLPVLEYLLFGDLQRLHEDGVSNRNCAYAAALARAVADDAGRLLAAWETSGDDFRAQLIEAGAGSERYTKLAEAISDSANAIFIAVEVAESSKLARPLGRRDGGEAQPNSVESRYSGNAIADLLDNFAGIRSVYTSTYDGVSGESYSAVIAGIDSELDTQVKDYLDRCDDALSAITGPLDEAVVSTPEEVETAFQCAKDLLRLLKVDVAGALGVTPTFGDVDGD